MTGRLSQVLSSLGLSETFTYDPRGNITSATYYDSELEEDVTEYFSYSGDRLDMMTRGEGQDAEEYSFTYDNRGRMTYCGAEEKYTAYNFLDLPSRIGRDPMNYSANYYYLADGMKTRVRDNTGEGGAMYIGPFVYGIYDDGGVRLEDAVVEDVSLCGDGVVARMTDYLGSARAVVNMNDGELYDEFRYSAYGMPAFIAPEFEEDEEFPYGMFHNLRFTGKEDQRHWTGTKRTDFGARHLDHTIRQWMVPDPLSEKYYTVSPYAYCAGDPVNLVDPNGMYTKVCMNDDGTYTVLGGVLNDDCNIYVYTQDENGEYTVQGESIGVSMSPYSFYNADDGKWATGAIIDPNDMSGMDFLNDEIINDTPGLIHYMSNALNKEGHNHYNFKVNGNHYRGMPIGTENGKNVYASARDIGNFGAGYVAGYYNIPYFLARLAFDTLQSIETTEAFYMSQTGGFDINTYPSNYLIWTVESKSSSIPERIGWITASINRRKSLNLFP